LITAGVEVHRGALDSLHDGVAAADGVIHLAFSHDFSDYSGVAECGVRSSVVRRVCSGWQ
jgi:hypothetical protein